MNRKLVILLIIFASVLPGCSTSGNKDSDEPLVAEVYSLERTDDEVWQIRKDSDYYRFFNEIHKTYDSIIRDTQDPEEKRRLFIERDLKIAKERLNYMADEKLVKKVVGGTELAFGTNATGHLFRLQDVSHVPRQQFTPSDPQHYEYEIIEPAFSTKLCDAMTSIIQFDRQLKERGVQLIVVPVPNSSQVYAHQLSNGINLEDVVWHPWAYMIEKLLEYDVEVLDLLDLFKAYSGDNTVLNYIDHHWGQAGLDIVGRELGQRFERFDFDGSYYLDPQKFDVKRISVNMPNLIPYWDKLDEGYIRSKMNIGMKYDTVGITYEGSVIQPVSTFEQSPVLLMGDSFVPHLAESSSGIYAHLAYYTHILPYAISQNAGAAKPPAWYMRYIAGKGKEPKVVIWEIYGSAFNEVNNLNDWMVVKMPEPDPSAIAAEPAAKVKAAGASERNVSWISGEVVEVSSLPKVEDAATYPDALYAYKVRVTDKQTSGLSNGETIVIYSQYLKEYEVIGQNIVSIGDTLSFFIEDWQKAEKATDKIGTMQLIDDLDDFESDVYYCYVLE